MKCFEKIGDDNNKSLFNVFYHYALGYNAQSHYLHKCVDEGPVKRVRVKDKDASRSLCVKRQ